VLLLAHPDANSQTKQKGTIMTKRLNVAALAMVSSFICSHAYAQFDLGKLKDAAKQMQNDAEGKGKPQTTPPAASPQAAQKPTGPLTVGADKKDSGKKEIAFREPTSKDAEVIKNNKSLLAWVAKYTKSSGGKPKALGGIQIADDIRVSTYGNETETLVLKGLIEEGNKKGIVLVVGRSPISEIELDAGEESKFYFVDTKINGAAFTSIRYDIGDGHLNYIYAPDMVFEATGILLKCNLDEDFFKENTYKDMIASGKAKLHNLTVLDYSVGGAPELGHSISVQAPMSAVVKELRFDPDFAKVKLPLKKKIGKVCTATANISEEEKGITRIRCGCNIE
jgi:hypothetical protein